MRLSNSKEQLARLLIEAGVTKFPEGANWAAQDKRNPHKDDVAGITLYTSTPKKPLKGEHYWGGNTTRSEIVMFVETNTLIPNWHQTVLSRDEFDLIVAKTIAQSELDTDGWTEWSGVPRSPVSKGTKVDVKMKNGTQHFGHLIDDEYWSDCWGDANIIAYRLHKPEVKHEFCESVPRSIPEPESIDGLCAKVTEENKHQHVDAKSTIEQLAQDYRNAKDYAERKQQEADDARYDADAKLKALELAGEALGLLVSPITAKQEPELATVQVGDEVECVESNIKRDKYNGMVGRLRTIDESDTSTPYLVDFGSAGKIWCHEVKFIRRPSK